MKIPKKQKKARKNIDICRYIDRILLSICVSIYRQYLGVDDISILVYYRYLLGGQYFDIDILSILPKILKYHPSIWVV